MLQTERAFSVGISKASGQLRDRRRAGQVFCRSGSLDCILEQNFIKEQKICPWLQNILSSRELCQECFLKNIMLVSRGTDYLSQRLLQWYFLQSKEFYYSPGKGSFFTAYTKPQISRKNKTKTYKQENKGLKVWTCMKSRWIKKFVYIFFPNCKSESYNEGAKRRIHMYRTFYKTTPLGSS